MIEIVDRQSMRPLGVEYAPEEHEVAVGAVAMYAEQLAKGIVHTEPDVIAMGLEVSDRVQQYLKGDSTFVDWELHNVLSHIFLPFLVKIDDQMPRRHQRTISRELGYKRRELRTRAAVARSMLDESGLEFRFVG